MNDGGDCVPGYEYNKEYAKKYIGKFDELKTRIPKGRKADIEAHAQRKQKACYFFKLYYKIKYLVDNN